MKTDVAASATTSPFLLTQTSARCYFEGRGADTVAAFVDDLTAHEDDASAIESLSIDMSSSFI
jgi:hypothetical protein